MSYLDELLEEYKRPERKRILPGATHVGASANVSCGDHVEVQLRVEDGIIREAAFLGEGCVISQVSAERLTGELTGKRLAEAQTLSEEAVLALLETRINPARERCALTAHRALITALKKNGLKREAKGDLQPGDLRGGVA